MGTTKQFDSLDTSYVSLSGLIRHLREQNFRGSIHVALPHYEAEVLLDGESASTASEIDPVTGNAVQSEGAMERLLVHAREPGGTITVYETTFEANIPDEMRPTADSPEDDEVTTTRALEFQLPSSTAPPAEEIDWNDLLDAGGKLMGAVERAVQSLGQDFDSNFRAVGIELGDDYPFLDPTASGLTYANKKITLGNQPAGNAFVTGLSECLRRIVNKLAMGKERKRFREIVAVELAVAARMRPNGMVEFTPHLDRIAGTRVL